VDLPEKVDLLATEIAGSIASEEGVYATIRDAQARFMKRPYDPSSYIPYSYETVGAPATDMCHHSGGNDPSRTGVRIEAHDVTMQLLADPKLVEEICFADPWLPGSGTIGAASQLIWWIDPKRVDANRVAFTSHLKEQEAALAASGMQIADLTFDLSRSLSGIALWPRIVFDEEGSLVYDARGPKGEHQTSHWPTFLPLLASRPVRVEAGDVVRARWEVDLQDGQVMTPLRYSMACDIQGAAGRAQTSD